MSNTNKSATSSSTNERLFTKVFLENFDLSHLNWGFGPWHEKVKTNVYIGGNSYGRCVEDLPNYGRLFPDCDITLSEAEISKLGKLPGLEDMVNVRSLSAEGKLKYEDLILKSKSELERLNKDTENAEMFDIEWEEDEIVRYTKIIYKSEISPEVLDLFEDLCKVFILGLLKCVISKPLYYEFYKILEFAEILIKKLGNCSKTYKKKYRFDLINFDSPHRSSKPRQLTEEQVKIHQRLVEWMS